MTYSIHVMVKYSPIDNTALATVDS